MADGYDFSEYKLLRAPHPSLDTPCQGKSFDDSSAEYRHEVSDYMWGTMTQNHGVGLAANQINLFERCFVMKKEGKRLDCFNPEILEVSPEKTLMLEGCLSELGLYMKVKRPSAIRAQWENKEGELIIEELYGMDARIFLHEFDHLQGIMFTDRVGSVKLKAARKKQAKILKDAGFM